MSSRKFKSPLNKKSSHWDWETDRKWRWQVWKRFSVKVTSMVWIPRPKTDTTAAMKRPKLTTASTVVLLLFVLSGEAVCKSRGHFSGVGFDFATGGYRDVAVIVSPELSRAECPQILDDVKVGSERKEEHIWHCSDCKKYQLYGLSFSEGTELSL